MSRALVSLVVALTFASACTGSGSIDSAPGTDDAPGELAFVDEPDTAPLLRVALGREIFGDRSESEPGAFDLAVFDPLLTALGDQGAVIVTDLLYDGLTEAVGRSGELRPGLALSWEANEDFTQWDFVLDPERANADEVKASFQRLVEAGGLLAALLDDVVGTEAFLSGDALTVRGLVAVDDDTFSIHLDRPNAGLAWLLSGVGFSVVGERGGLTGRFALDDSLAEDEGSEDESDSADVDGFDSVVLRSDVGDVELVWSSNEGSDDGARLNASALLSAGVADVAVAQIASSGDDVAEAGASPDGDRVVGTSRFVVLSGVSAEMADLLKREAVVASIDGDALGTADSLLGAQDAGLLSSALSGFEPGGCVWCVVSVDRQRDLAQVVPTIGPLVVGFSGAEQEAVVEVLIEQLNQAGFVVSAAEMSPIELAVGVEDGSIDLFLFGWTAPAGSLDGSVAALFSSTGFSNVFGLGWDEVDELLDTASLVADDDERWRLLREAEVKALSQFVAVPLGSVVARTQGVEAVDGLVVRADGSLDLAGVS